jgi:hypothetical protein
MRDIFRREVGWARTRLGLAVVALGVWAGVGVPLLVCLVLRAPDLVRAQVPVSSLVLQTPPPPAVSSVGAAMVGYTGPGTTLYYWVVARYPAGAAQPAGPASVPNTPGSPNLSASRLVRISWTPVAGATGYDVLRGDNPLYPAQTSCGACAVALNTTALTVDDTGGALGAYPPAGLLAAQAVAASIAVTNRDTATPLLQMDKPVTGAQTIPGVTGTPTAGDFAVFGANTSISSTASASVERTYNKDQPNGYAGLTAGTKLKLAEGQEVWGLADLSDVTTKRGNSTTVQMATGAVATSDCAAFDANGNLVSNGAACASAVQTGAYAGLPAPTALNVGGLYLANDVPLAFRSTGAAWVPFGPVYGPLSLPPSTGWSNLNMTGMAAVDFSTGALLLTSDTANEFNYQVRAIPATPYTISALVYVTLTLGSDERFAIGWRESATGKMVTFYAGRRGGSDGMFGSFGKWSDYNTWNSDYVAESGSNMINSVLWMFNRSTHYLMRIADDGVNLSCYYSTDGYRWVLYHTAARTNYMLTGPDQLAVGVRASIGQNPPPSIRVVSWVVQ